MQFLHEYTRAWCSNRGRQRRKLANILESLNRLQVGSEAADAAAHARGLTVYAPAFFSWVSDFVFATMTAFCYLGFPLQLYAQHELDSVFWCVWRYQTSGQPDLTS